MLGFSDAGWSSLAARRAHNPKVTGSNPVPATKEGPDCKVRAFVVLALPGSPAARETGSGQARTTETVALT